MLGEIWIKYQVAQFARMLSTLLAGGIPLVQALETAARRPTRACCAPALEKAQRHVKEGQSLSAGAGRHQDVFPPLAIDMVEVGESTGALPPCSTAWPSSMKKT